MGVGMSVCDHTRASRLATRYVNPSAESRAGARGVTRFPSALLPPQERPTLKSVTAFFPRGWHSAGTALGTRCIRSNVPSARICFGQKGPAGLG